MCHSMRDEARSIIDRAIQAVLPDEAVFRTLKSRPLTGRVLLVAAGKAA